MRRKKETDKNSFGHVLARTTNDVLPREGRAKNYTIGNTVHNRIDYTAGLEEISLYALFRIQKKKLYSCGQTRVGTSYHSKRSGGKDGGWGYKNK